jgi:hypothetical protein
LQASFETLTQLARYSWEPALRLLNVKSKFICASDLPVVGKGPALLLEICKYVGADIYLSGAFGREYIDKETFLAQGVEVKFHEYDYPTYPQRFDGFLPFLSYIDMLFNAGLPRDEVMAGGRMVSR